MLAGPDVVLAALTRHQATCAHRDLAKFAHRHSDGQEQFERIVSAMRHHDSVVALGRDGRGDERFTTRAMLSSEQRLVCDAAPLAASTAHRSEERRVGKECVSTCRYWWSPYP